MPVLDSCPHPIDQTEEQDSRDHCRDRCQRNDDQRDVRATLKKKLDADFDNYVILGACNPPFAYRALQAERDIGLLMPCNVIVYEEGGDTFISAIMTTVAMSMVENEQLAALAAEVEAKLKKVVDIIAR